MTQDEIMRLKGSELDQAVAEHVMGYIWSNEAPHKGELVHSDGSADYLAGHGPLSHVRPYSTDMAAAWQVVERLTELEKDEGLPFDVRVETVFQGWMCTVKSGCEIESEVRSETAPLAICRAALMAANGGREA